ncbi:MAG TPA: ribbon-helix-helix protein, CopG family [Promineifilum sp.]|nr:ribbon-helix-helix protein, CopG family [Promineifilum sp.]HRO24190.1 ribbon-helix-helix protein, CopG family [Promineifilum sp.]HRO90736.1 ribbon-helix-helix protein, CopG family [Promineifilum sp.]HRQ13256.1 ribbon-helix-helix protein, CopG family [Promineifilum sp.]
MIPTTTVRISRKTRDIIQEMAQTSGRSMQDIMEEAIAAYQGRQLLEATNAAYAVLKDNPGTWRELQEERAEWDAALNDGLEEL